MGTINDGIDAAFAELVKNGIVAVQNAGYTMADGWAHPTLTIAPSRFGCVPPIGVIGLIRRGVRGRRICS